MRVSGRLGPSPEWPRIENRGTETHTFELAWWNDTEPVVIAAIAGGPEAASGTEEGKQE